MRRARRSSPAASAATIASASTLSASGSPARLDQDGAEVREQRGAAGLTGRQQRDGALQQPSRRRCDRCGARARRPADSSRSAARVASARVLWRRPARARTGSARPARGGSRRSPRSRAVVSPPARSSQPAKRPCSSAASPWAATVGGVADQDVAEAERVVLGEAGDRTDQVPADERARLALYAPPERRRGELVTAARWKRCPPPIPRASARSSRASRSSRARAAPGSWAGGQSPSDPVIASLRHRASSSALVDQHREQLLGEQWITFGGLGDPAVTSGGASSIEVATSSAALLGG